MDVDQYARDIQRQYLDFLDDATEKGFYQAKVQELIARSAGRLIVNINDLRAKNEVRCRQLLGAATEELLAFQNALKEYVASLDSKYASSRDEFYIGFEGSFGSRHVSPRSLSATFLGNLVCCEGIVTKCSLVWPKVVRSVHFCPKTHKTIERRYTDMTSLSTFPSSAVYPTKDEDGNPLETEYGLSAYRDHQMFTIQEMPEKAPAGQLPRSIDVIADADLVDVCKPGDRVQVVGIYRCLPSKKFGFTAGTFKTVLLVDNIKILTKNVAADFSANDVAKIRRFSKTKKGLFDTLAKSLAPSIHGHDYIKKAILCMLLGGTEKVLDNGTRLRGDINILMVGDPSTAKSQLLRYVLNVAPRAVATTGRGSSGVGLTAAVTTDQETGERRLEAGAMVLADRGIVCIDEFDKMSDIDRTAIHEVMEQGRVSIAKAGIHAKLNARCSVLAAANPVYGRYDEYRTPMENIGMQDSILSRFDLLFIVLDEMEPESDRKIADHVLKMHRYRTTGEQEGEAMLFGEAVSTLSTINPDTVGTTEEDTPIYEKQDTQLYSSSDDHREKFVSLSFLKKYIHVAKMLKPALSEEAADTIALAYADLRDQENIGASKAKTTPVTARTLETLIRLSTAHSKARMSKTVDRSDAEAAIEMVQFAYFHKVEKKPPRRRAHEDFSTGQGDDSEEEEEASQSQPKKRPRPADDSAATDEPYSLEQDDGQGTSSRALPDSTTTAADSSLTGTPLAVPDSTGSSVSEARLAQFRICMNAVFTSAHAQSLALDDVVRGVQRHAVSVGEAFSQDETTACLNAMQESNQVMVAGKTVYLI